MNSHGYFDSINILNGFQDYSKLNFDGVQDINFFFLKYGLEIIWFTAILDISNVSLYQINDRGFYGVAAYPVVNGTQIIADSCNYGALLIIQSQNGSVLILRFTKILNNYYLRSIQDFELNDMTHLTIWKGMNQLHLGIASDSNVSIFTWFGNYFDLIQIINVGTKKLIPFQSKGFMYLAITGSTTYVFKYFLKSNEFLVMQRLPFSQDVSFFELKNGHFMEHFLSLSTESLTVIYKEIHDRFVPFQQISSGKFAVPIILNRAIILLTWHEDTMVTFQYDGWRFVELHIRLSGISHFHQVILYGKKFLLVKDKHNRWILKELLWIKKKSYKDLQKEIKIWNINAMNTVQKRVEEVPQLNNPIRILRGHIDQLHVHNINEHNSQKLKSVSEQYKNLVSKFQGQKIIINNKWHPENLTLISLHAKRIQVKCKIKCKINKLNVKRNANLLSKLTMSNNMNADLSYKKLKVKEIKNWKCPFVSLPIEDIIIDKSINGISLSNLLENALKVSANQEVLGEHTFSNVNVTNASMLMNIATYLTKQEVKIKDVKVRELNLTEGGILLPLNGTFTIMTGSINVHKLKVKENLRLQGSFTGKWATQVSPIIFTSQPMILDGNFNLENVKIENLNSTDLIVNKIGLVKNILSNAISLYNNVPVSLLLSSKAMKWSNITLHGHQNWITANSQNVIMTSARKKFLHNVEVPQVSYNNLKLLRYTNLCAITIIAPEIRTFTLAVNNITVKSLTSSRVFGNLGERHFSDNSTFLFESILPGEQYYRNITTKNIITTHLNNINLRVLKMLANSWVEPNVFNASIETTNLIINNLLFPIEFHEKLVRIRKNIILEQDTHVDDINHVNFANLLANAIKLEDMIPLQNITFSKGFTSNRMHTFYFPSYLMEMKRDFNLHEKRISGNIEVNTMNLAYSFELTENNIPVNIIVKELATFPMEPIIKNINNTKLEELFTEVWIATNLTTFHGKNLYIKDALMKGNISLSNSTNILNSAIWKDISERVLSKTKLQKIIVPVFLHNIKVPAIVDSSVSIIKSSVSDINDMFNNLLVKNTDQKVQVKWTFNTLKILGKLYVKNRMNSMDLKKDVMRNDFKENIVTEKKIINVLTVENLNGYGFDKWAKNVLMQKKKHVTIKGRKKFNTVTFSNIKVSGTIMEYNIAEALSKSKNQTIYGQKIIQGSINASELIINGLINDVNLTKLMDHQLKKHKSLQKIRTGIELQNSLNIVGNLTINGTYSGAEMKNFYQSYFNEMPIAEKIKKFSRAAETINTALRNRVAYINKLKVIKDIIHTSNKSASIQKAQCKAANFSSYCTNQRLTNLVFKMNISDFILIESITLNEIEFIIVVKFDAVSIYSYSNEQNNLIHLKDLHIPKIMDAFVEPMLHSLWIMLRLPSQTLVLHYQAWKDLQEYVLPATDVFIVSRTRNDQLLLLLSDGVWNLMGLASPRKIIGIPLKEKVETFADGFYYYVKCISKNSTVLLKARYVGN
ncbi:PREDICTED: uncharacterized protein LOC108573234 [Habropoda laboriosa]|uniref:uncharacterized protein LOC108573234 n=1 Tax=Habropoda laboriosa TaxID=597456 RepID=UPI00083D9C11|nr:PREDICTED: uncharacterized protein LOC108573234 [Habropoda laboriosa]